MSVGDFDISKAKARWDSVRRQNIGAAGQPTPFAAKTFGLTINDWDGGLKKRITKLATKDLYIPFQYLEEIPNWEKSSSWSAAETPMGRFEPIQVYANGEAQDVTLDLFYHAETYEDQNTWSLKFIETMTQRIKSLQYPIYDDEFAAPPKCLLNIGSVFVDVPVAIKQVNVTNSAPYDYQTGLSMLRKITISAVISYPMWQAVSGTQVFASSDAPGKVFAYKQLPKASRSGYTKQSYIGNY